MMTNNNDDFGLPDVPSAPPVRGRNRERMAPREALATAAFEAATTPALLRRLTRRVGLAVVVQVPTAAWVSPIRDHLAELLPDGCEYFRRDGSDRKTHTPAHGNDDVAEALSAGRTIVGVSQSPEQLLPASLTSAADVTIVISPPTPAVLARALKFALRGRLPAELPAGLGAGMDFPELIAALRPTGMAREAVERLQATARARVADPSGARLPPPPPAVHNGAAREWGLALAADVAAVGRGEIAWSDVDRGAVFFGPPGTGKTWLAKLIARACDLPIVESSVADLFATSSGYLDGVIKSQRALFERAAATAPCVLFIDELDAMPNRATLSSRGRDWWQPVIDDFLILVASTPAGVLLLGATNRIEDVDAGLLRPGRFERTIEVRAPDAAEGLASLLRFHLGGDLAGADLVPLARLGLGATAAQAMDFVRSARRRARGERRVLTLDDLAVAIAPPDPRTSEQLRRSATHEAGHAVVALALDAGEIQHASIVRNAARGGGVAVRIDLLRSREQFEAQATVSLAGRAAEIVALNSASAGAGGNPGSDLANATRILAVLHASLGLGDALLYRADPDAAQELLQFDPALRATVAADLERLHGRAAGIIRQNRAALRAIADALIERRFLVGDELGRLFVEAGGRTAIGSAAAVKDSTRMKGGPT